MRLYCTMPGQARTVSDDVRDDNLTREVIGCAIKIHRALGPGLLESAYDGCLAYELAKSGFSIARHVTLPVIYEGVRIDVGYRPDIIVNDELMLELKTVAQLLPVHDAQLLTYLRLSGIERGLLMNFHAQPLIRGVKRLVLSRGPAVP